MQVSTPRLFAAAAAIWGTTWIAITFQLGRGAARGQRGAALRASPRPCSSPGAGPAGLRLRFPPRVHAELALLGLFMFCLSYLAVYRAETFLVSGLVAVGYSASPLVNAAISRVAFGTPATPRGPGRAPRGGRDRARLLAGAARVRADAGVLAGAGLVAVAVLASGVGNVFASRLERHGLTVWQKMAWGMAWGAAGSALAALAGGEGFHFSLTPAYLASLLYLAVFGSIAAFAAYLTLLERVGAARAGYVGVMTPVVALAVSGVVEGFRWGPTTFLGIAVVVAGNLVVLRSR